MGSFAVSMTLLLAALGGETGRTSSVTDHVDLVEINHFCDDYGRAILHQMIFYDWCPETGRYQVRDWQPLRKDYQFPTRDWRTNRHVAVWFDKGVKRIVEADLVRETWTQHDPELIERNYLAPDERGGLSPLGRVGIVGR
ncbi:MAG TPA: hypothetical protein PLI18_04320 [Pirellulaceae bacterium]|nr:hypothetical protein [Pirellulaceae bacterium]